MYRTPATVLLLALAPAAAFAQATTASGVLRILARQNDTFMVASANAMPADKYSFKPTPAQMSFGEVVIHTEDTNRFECAAISGTPAPAEAKLQATDSKATLVAALKASFTFCRSVLSKVQDTDLAPTVPYYGGHPAPKAVVLMDLAADWGDHYAIMAMYLRLNGIKPPTA